MARKYSNPVAVQSRSHAKLGASETPRTDARRSRRSRHLALAGSRTAGCGQSYSLGRESFVRRKLISHHSPLGTSRARSWRATCMWGLAQSRMAFAKLGRTAPRRPAFCQLRLVRSDRVVQYERHSVGLAISEIVTRSILAQRQRRRYLGTIFSPHRQMAGFVRQDHQIERISARASTAQPSGYIA